MDYEGAKTVLLDITESIVQRMRAVFCLRTLGTPQCVETLIQAYEDTSSSLLQHELCYVLGQIADPLALEFLISVMEDTAQPSICRHEAAEAVGAIAQESALDKLILLKSDPLQIVAETCELAIDRIQWLKHNKEFQDPLIHSIDPAPAFAGAKPLLELSEIYNNSEETLFNRYRALFSLRNIGTDEAVVVMAFGLNNPAFSDLFQHEIAFVFGQMQEKATAGLTYLLATLHNVKSHSIVRHEAAEAIGAITSSPESLCQLSEFLNDPCEAIRSSCAIALDISDSWF